MPEFHPSFEPPSWGEDALRVRGDSATAMHELFHHHIHGVAGDFLHALVDAGEAVVIREDVQAEDGEVTRGGGEGGIVGRGKGQQETIGAGFAHLGAHLFRGDRLDDPEELAGGLRAERVMGEEAPGVAPFENAFGPRGNHKRDAGKTATFELMQRQSHGAEVIMLYPVQRRGFEGSSHGHHGQLINGKTQPGGAQPIVTADIKPRMPRACKTRKNASGRCSRRKNSSNA